MTRFWLVPAAVVLAACGVLDSVARPPTYGLVIVNDSDAPVFWSVEQPTGEMTRFMVQPCSSTSKSIDVGRDWEVELGATFAVTSDEVQVLDAAVTIVEVRFDARGGVSVAAPRPAEVQPDAPIDGLTCADP